ncbi:lipoprotein N-acyltransferase Lnb domain-containing protein [Tenacibaculum agarivorans]|uniref:lipoprotein N-acyltransferase Lnb domain-containing protein n=1 Tax=Tenacibaculum agarivorans TaxID=1908389 RepID=UPI00094BA70A|nr:DUF4105 domain-containing protein [Tenacibaculum agarivorans]
MIKKLSFIVFITSLFFGFSQNVKLSNFSQISIITSGPGDNLYEKFGHTAIRIKDPVLNLDLLYNYGIFDFNDPNFYVNFVKGFMKYKLARYPFHYSLKSANQDERWVKEQVLNLTVDERNAFFMFLEINAQPKNASYFYDPFFDNCATRPKDIIKKEVLKNKIIFNDSILKTPKSLRTLMNEKIHPNTWGSFGINLALGSRLDKISSIEEYMYLPEYLYTIFSSSKINKEGKELPLISKTNELLKFEPKLPKSDVLSPFLIFSLLLVLTCLITFFDIKRNKRTKALDFSIFFISGLLGVLIVFLWFFTNHSTAPNNFNFLWALAPNLVIAFVMLKSSFNNWVKYYLIVLLLFLIVIPVISLIGIQKFTYPFYPILLLISIRYLYLIKWYIK